MNVGVASSDANDGSVPKNTPHRVQTLSRTGIRDVTESKTRRDALFAAAATLRQVCAPVTLTDMIAERELAVLADALANEQERDHPVRAAGAVTFDTALNRFLTALDAAIPAVRTCRQTAHSVNHCWFSTATTNCGDVLKSAHNHAY